MKRLGLSVLTVAVSLAWAVDYPFNVNLPQPKEGAYVHKAPTVEELMADEKMHPELKKVILQGRDLFMNTQQLRGKYVFNDMNCKSCHMGEGGLNFAGPVWPAATTLPDFRGKNGFVNSFEERIAGCFSYSMNGISPEYGSDIMVALTAYHQWLAKGSQVYETRPIAGRGFRIPEPELKPDYARGEKVYQEHCATCHGVDGQGVQGVFPPVWGDRSYNWGAGMSRIPILAGFVHWNMPLGQPGKLSHQESWDVAYFINGHDRPQDPRYTGDVKETREKYKNFHDKTLYGLEVNGVLLGDHQNTGDKPLLKPWPLVPRTYETAGSKALFEQLNYLLPKKKDTPKPAEAPKAETKKETTKK